MREKLLYTLYVSVFATTFVALMVGAQKESPVVDYFFYTLLLIGIAIEVFSVYLDWQVMRGKSRVSSFWPLAFGIFVLFWSYGSFRGNSKDVPFTINNELIVASLLILFQIFFHIIFPIIRFHIEGKK